MSGPTYDLELVAASGSLGALREAVSSVPGVMAWTPRDDQTRVVVQVAGLRPVGVLVLDGVSRASKAWLTLVIYPPQMRSVCGQDIWESPKTDASLAALRDVHDALLELTRWVHARVPLERACLHDETYSMPEIESSSGFLWVQSNLASVIGWAGFTVEDWTGIAL